MSAKGSDRLATDRAMSPAPGGLLRALEDDDPLLAASAAAETTTAAPSAAEIVFAQEPGTELVVDAGKDDAQGAAPRKGTLFVTSSRVAWVEEAAMHGVQIEYPALNMHAVCKEDSVVQRPCMYCQLLAPAADSDEEASDDSAYEELIEVRFVPDDAEALPRLFEAFSRGAALFPDQDEEAEGDEDANEASLGPTLDFESHVELLGADAGFQASQAFAKGEWFTAETVDGLDPSEAEALQAKLDHWDSLLVLPDAAKAAVEPGQFDDAPEPGQFDDAPEPSSSPPPPSPSTSP